MTAVVLPHADLALFTDLTQRVQFPHLTAAANQRGYAGSTVQFSGDTYPTAFSGVTRTKSWQMQARYKVNEQDQLLALLTLLDAAHDAPDRRLLLRTHYGQAVGLDDATAVVVFAVEQTPQMGLYVDVSFTCEAVQFSLEV